MAKRRRPTKRKAGRAPAAAGPPAADPSPSRVERPVRLHQGFQALLVAGLALVLYANTLGHGYVLDDPLVTTANRLVKAGEIDKLGEVFRHGYSYGVYGREGSSYRPLTLASLLLERWLFGTTPAVHHLFNLLYYAILCALALLALRLLFGDQHRGKILAVALLFTAHPIHTEVVANIKSRDEILALLFSLIALSLVLLASRRQRVRYQWAGALAFFLALLAKESAVAFIVIVPLALFFCSPSSGWREIARRSLPCLLLLLVYFAIRAAVLGDSFGGGSGSLGVINNGLLAASGPTERWATAIAILGKYLRLLVVPHPLLFDYSYRQVPIVGLGHPAVLGSIALHLALAGYAAWGLRRRNPAAFGVIWYGTMLAMVSNLFFLVGATAAERFLFAPSFGFCLALVFGLSRPLQRFSARPRAQRAAQLAVALTVTAWGLITVTRNTDWKDEATLFASDVVKAPNNARVLSYHAKQLVERARSMADPDSLRDQAETLLKRSLALVPQNHDAWNTLGNLYFLQRKYRRAVEAYTKALPTVPENHPVWLNLAMAHHRNRNYTAAEPLLRKVLARDPTNRRALGYLGEILHRRGEYRQALQYYEAAAPHTVARLSNITRIARHLGQHDKARRYQQQLDAARAGETTR